MFATRLFVLALALLLGTVTLTEAHPHQVRSDRSATRAHNVVKRATASSVSIPGWAYKGCVTEGSKRALPAANYTNPAMTVEICTAFCRSKGYSLSGLQGKDQCYCDFALRNGLGAAASEWTCDAVCGGDATELCGGHWKMSLYQASTDSSSSSAPSATSSKPASTSASASNTSSVAPTTSAAAATPTALGCFSNPSSGRLLNSAGITTSTITPVTCTNYCVTKGYGYAGVTSGNQCWCGNTLDMSQKLASDDTCSTPCAADKSYMCGASNRFNVYVGKPGVGTTTGVAPSATTSKPASSTTTSKPVSSSTSASASASASSSSSEVRASSTIGVAAVPKSTGTKALYAHHMVGNTYSYTPSIWSDDIAQASAAGIDGFALNYGRDSWQPARLSDAYDAATGTGFKMFLSMDVSSLGCGSTSDAANLVDTVVTFTKHPAQAKLGNASIVSTFAGESCTFGQSSMDAGWTYFRSLVAAKNTTIYFIPGIFSDISTFKSSKWMDGEFNWNSAWPMGGDALSTASDTSYMNALGDKGYMPGVSPAFFTYYSPSTYNKNWIYRGDDWLLARRMEQIIAMRDKTDMAEIISWNDYGESHYIGPIRADQPNSQGWTNGMPHTAWLEVIKYYAPAYKTGAYPAANDQIVLWTRPHPKAAKATSPSMDRPTRWDDTDDLLYVWVALKAASTVTVSSGTTAQAWNLPAGVSKVSIPSNAGKIAAKIVRNGSQIKYYSSEGTFSYTTTPSDYNFNYFVASA